MECVILLSPLYREPDREFVRLKLYLPPLNPQPLVKFHTHFINVDETIFIVQNLNRDWPIEGGFLDFFKADTHTLPAPCFGSQNYSMLEDICPQCDEISKTNNNYLTSPSIIEIRTKSC